MPCYTLVLQHPYQSRAISNVMLCHRLEHLASHACADLQEISKQETTLQFRITACDEDVITILRDVPAPMTCIEVRNTHTKELLYSNRKVTKVWTRPPRELLLKRIYWQASKLEQRNQCPQDNTYKNKTSHN